MFASETRAYPRRDPLRSSTQVGSGLSCKYQIKLERPATYKRFSLLGPHVSYGEKMFCKYSLEIVYCSITNQSARGQSFIPLCQFPLPIDKRKQTGRNLGHVYNFRCGHSSVYPSINSQQVRLGQVRLDQVRLGKLRLVLFCLVLFCFVWSGFFGLVWIGLDWFGLVWIGLDWFGLVWIGLDWFGLVCFGLSWFNYLKLKTRSKLL